MSSHDLIDFRLAAIFMMAIVTLLIRLGGFWLMGRVPITARVRRMLEALPGSIVAAAVLPIAAKTGFPACAAVGTAVIVMILHRGALIAVAAGMLAAMLARGMGA